MRYQLKFVMTIVVAALAASCTFISKNSNVAAERPTGRNTKGSAASGVSATTSERTEPEAGAEKVEVPASKEDCFNIDTGDDLIQRSQTFPISFEPFAGSCFVTTYNPEYDDPPLESKFAVYKNNKLAFDFPGRFNGVEFGCWVDAVAFDDLNGDGLKDIVVVGKCSGKSSTYNENMVYVNSGKAFVTDQTANARLGELKKAKDTSYFVKKDQKLFFK